MENIKFVCHIIGINQINKKILLDLDFMKMFHIIDLDNFNREILEPIVNNLIKKNKTNFKGVGQPLRVILTGSKFGPGLYDILISLGKEEVKQRLGNEIIGQNC